MKHSISESSLKRFASGTASREEGKTILAHLLRGCSTCSGKLQELMGPLEQSPGYNEVLDRFEQAPASAHPLGSMLVGPARHGARRPAARV